MPQNLPSLGRAQNDALSLFRRLSSSTVASSFQLQSSDPSGGQIYNRSNLTLDSLSTPFGYQAIASGNRSAALGAFAYAKEDSSVAVGVYAQAFGPSSIAMGDQTIARMYRALAIGTLAQALAVNAVAIGTTAAAQSKHSIAIGNRAFIGINTGGPSSVGSQWAIAIGFQAACGDVTPAASGIAIGENAGVEAEHAIGIGSGAFIGDAAAEFSVAIGQAVEVDALGGVALGSSSFITTGHDYSVALGYGATTTLANQFMIGSTTAFILDQQTICGANGQAFHVKRLTELTTIAAAATTDTVIQIPANVIVKAVTVRTTVAIPTATNYTVTGTSSATTFNTAAVSSAANSTDKGNAAGAFYNAAAQTIRITPDATPAANTGRVRVTIIWEDVTPATS